MSMQQPTGTSLLNAPSHSKAHRVWAWDDSAPDKSVTVRSGGELAFKYGPTVDVTHPDFGADPTGASDSSTAITNAANSLTNGGVVYLPPGTYLANNLPLKASVVYRGARIGATIIKNTSATNHTFTTTSDVDYWGVEELTIQNTDASCEDGIYVEPSSGTSRMWTIKNVRVEGGNNAVRLVKCYLGTVDNLDILLGSGGRLVTGLALGDGTNVSNANVFNQLWVTAATGDAAKLNKTHSNIFNGITIQSCTGNGITSTGAGANNTFNNPHFEANTGTYDIMVEQGNDVINSAYLGSTATTNSIQIDGQSCEVNNPNLPNATTPAILFDSNSNRSRLKGGWYQNGFKNQVTDNGTDTLFFVNHYKGRRETLVVTNGTATVYDADHYTYGGNVDIVSLDATWDGHEITILFSGNASINGVVDGGNLKIAGNFAYTTNDILKLVCDGTNWYEISRAAN